MVTQKDRGTSEVSFAPAEETDEEFAEFDDLIADLDSATLD